MAFPIVGRLSWYDYKRLVLAIAILCLESVLRFVTWLVPLHVLDFLRYHLVGFFPRLFQGFHNEDIKETADPIFYAHTTPQLIRFHGFECEEHVVLTTDGYYLVLHRILAGSNTNTSLNGKNGSKNHGIKSIKDTKDHPLPPSPQISNSSVTLLSEEAPGPLPTLNKPALLVIHGAMMSSEIWVCQPKKSKNLVFNLVEHGFDIWLANRRGTKYSQKHVTWKPYEARFWDYSLDETIVHDVPATVDYVLGVTQQKRISLLGFSQGSAEIMGATAINRRLAPRINCVVAISAAAIPPIPRNTLIRSMVQWYPELGFLIFGRKAMLSSVTFWQGVLSPRAMAWLMDVTMRLLFGWTNANIRSKDKPVLYRHLYDTASVKQIAHWFQIMRSCRFQLFDDQAASGNRIVPSFPLHNPNMPKLLIMGGRDCLVEVEGLLPLLRKAQLLKVEEYEHMDPIWATDADRKVFPAIIDFLKKEGGISNYRKSRKKQSNTFSQQPSGTSSVNPFAWPL